VFLFLFKDPFISTQAIAVGDRYHFSVHRSTVASPTMSMSLEPPTAVNVKSSVSAPPEFALPGWISNRYPAVKLSAYFIVRVGPAAVIAAGVYHDVAAGGVNSQLILASKPS